MTLAELMANKTPSASYEGITNADDMVLAVNLAGSSKISGYIVAQEGISEATGSLEAETQEKQYLRSGKSTTKTGTSRTFNVTGDRIVGDDFQDAILDYSVKFGTGSAVVKDYIYFNILTGKGEKGIVSIAVTEDLSGAAGENATFTATLSSRGTPVEYTYSTEA